MNVAHFRYWKMQSLFQCRNEFRVSSRLTHKQVFAEGGQTAAAAAAVAALRYFLHASLVENPLRFPHDFLEKERNVFALFSFLS